MWYCLCVEGIRYHCMLGSNKKFTRGDEEITTKKMNQIVGSHLLSEKLDPNIFVAWKHEKHQSLRWARLSGYIEGDV